jgi:hypothetical protein
MTDLIVYLSAADETAVSRTRIQLPVAGSKVENKSDQQFWGGGK